MRFFNPQGWLLAKMFLVAAVCLSGCGNNSGDSSGKPTDSRSKNVLIKDDSVSTKLVSPDSGSELLLTKDDSVRAEVANKEKSARRIKADTGYFIDSRSGQKYRVAKIGDKTWMAENLNYLTGKSWCYGNDKSNCKQYGRLYDRNTAKVACPSGWYLPTREDWNDLATAAGGGMAGRALKSSAIGVWEDGVDSYGFSALPGGYRDIDGSFSNIGEYGYWWTASGNAYYRVMYDGINGVHEGNDTESFGFSVRCVQK